MVGRKRKPDTDDIEPGVELAEPAPAASKRMRVLDRLTEPFRRVAAAAALPTVARRNAEVPMCFIYLSFNEESRLLCSEKTDDMSSV